LVVASGSSLEYHGVLVQVSSSVLDVRRIIFPLHRGRHWTCAVIDLKEKHFIYYDSLWVS
jgi:Ulp1 family protease